MTRPAIFREAASALLFFGALVHQPELHQAGRAALAELAALGYRTPGAGEPVRIFPALTGGDLSGHHAGGWRPGSIYLRPHPAGNAGEAVYLRHELMHEASHRSCGGRLPLWVEEAAAMSFSGELAGPGTAAPPGAGELDALQEVIRRGGALGRGTRATLARLVTRAGWPTEPCAIPRNLAELLGAPFDEPGSSGYLLMSLASGRILEAGGDQNARFPPGSLLKIAYAAALREADSAALGLELASSDSGKLLQRWRQFDAERYRLLISPVQKLSLAKAWERAPARALLGERAADGRFPIEATLAELGRMLRASLLSRPEHFRGLARNGDLPGSTLAGRDEAEKNLLRKLHALAKTGTVSDERGQPLVGHLLVVWPAERPAFLAVFRRRGVQGSSVLQQAAPLLERWQRTHPPRFALVRVRLLSLTPRAGWEVREDCPALAHGRDRFSLCGDFRIVSSARGSRSERRVSGVLHEPSAGGPVILETDAETYADAVLAAEAQDLKGGAREAMRAVIVWNGSRGGLRHADTSALCDTTHCMVFLGAPPDGQGRRDASTHPRLLALLDKLASAAGSDWLPFAAGGEEHWERRRPAPELAGRLGEAQVLDIRRERRKDGGVFLHLLYPDAEEVVSCETFRNAFKLPSCPDALGYLGAENLWWFRGLGAGHGQGLAVGRAKALAEAGRSAEEILRDAYGGG